jgi:predicted DNA binding protein
MNDNELKYVTIKAKHEDCWTSYIQNDIILSLGRIVYPDKNIIRVFMILNNDNIKIIYTLKIQGKIKDILNISYNGKNSYIIDMLLPYKNSTLELLNNSNVLPLDMMNVKGYEIWNILAYSNQINELINTLNTNLRIKQTIIKSLNDKFDNLTSTELKAINTAFKLGYYEYPRKVSIRNIAHTLGIKDSTLSYHLRHAERKIISNFLKKVENID